MALKEVLAPQTSTSKEQVVKAVPSPKRANLPFFLFHINRENKNLQSRKNGLRANQEQQKTMKRKSVVRVNQNFSLLAMLVQQDSIPEMDQWTPGLLSSSFLKKICLAIFLLFIQDCVSAGPGGIFFRGFFVLFFLGFLLGVGYGGGLSCFN